MGAAMLLNDRIGRRMKLQDLNVLMTVVQAGSMVKAADRLNTCQPAISRSIAELEHAFGVRLLERHRQGIEPTEYGRALLDRALSDDLACVRIEISHQAPGAQGPARGTANGPCAKRDRHPEEPRTQPRRAAFH